MKLKESEARSWWPMTEEIETKSKLPRYLPRA